MIINDKLSEQQLKVKIIYEKEMGSALKVIIPEQNNKITGLIYENSYLQKHIKSTVNNTADTKRKSITFYHGEFLKIF